MTTELFPLVLRRLEDSLVMTSAASGARVSPAAAASESLAGCPRNELARFFARAAEQYYLGCESLVNDLYHNLVLERFCKERESSRIERGLAH